VAVRSKRLWGPTSVGTTAVVLYTCPAGETALLKGVHAFNPGALGVTVTYTLNGTGNSNTILTTSSSSGNINADREQWIVLHPGDVLRAVGSAGTTYVTGFGAELEGVAD